MHLRLLLFLLLSASAGFGQNHPFQKKLLLVDRYIDSLMKEWNVPGLALGIVYGDQLIYAKGYGYRDLEQKLPVTTATLFPIASNTKLFTATAAAMLAEEGKLSLDKPVRTYLPALQFNNEELNSRVTLRDMLSHRTGLPRFDGIWVASQMERKNLVSQVSYMKPALGFREGYIYNNMMYASAGLALESISGMKWEELVRSGILAPLSMNRTCFSQADMEKTGNFSYAYLPADSSRKLVRRVFVAQSEALGPAGTMKSNVEEMSHWMIAQLNQGKYKGAEVIAPKAIKQTMTPNIIADREARWDELSHGLYGMGRLLQSYKGYKLATHTGSIDGFFSNLSFLPNEKLAVFVVYNSSTMGNFRNAIAFPLFDRLLGLTQTPWSERYLKEFQEQRNNQQKFRDSIAATQVRNTQPSHPLSAYAGNFSHPVYGNMEVGLQDNKLILSYRGQQYPLLHFHYDQFISREPYPDRPEFRLNFLTNNLGKIDRISLAPFGDPVTEFNRKVGDK
jgi:CubicO group peptidase (beta-lactamase class C family)